MIDSISNLYAGANGIGASSSNELDSTDFMSLLVAQLQNQDPTNPVANEDFTAQLAQFSSLEEMQNVNANLQAMAALSQENALLSQLTTAAGLIGSNVDFIDPATGEQANGDVEAVRLETGLTLLRIDGEDVPLANVLEVHGEDDSSNDSDDESGDSDSGDSDSDQ